MKFSWAAFFLFIGMISGLLNQLTPIVPEDYRQYMAVLTGFVTLLGGLKAFYVNPDGTSAKVAFVNPPKTTKNQGKLDLQFPPEDKQ